MGFSSHLSPGNDDKGKRRGRSLLLCVIVVNHTSPSMRRRYHCRHLDRRQKSERPPTNNALAWLTRAILMRRILEFRRELRFPGDSTFDSPSCLPHVPYYKSVPLHSRVDRVNGSALPGCISKKRQACSTWMLMVPDFCLPLANEKYQGVTRGFAEISPRG
jgi:hypothetical protein